MPTALSRPLPDGRRPSLALGGRIGAILALAVLSIYVLIAGVVAANTHHGLDPGGAPMFFDFSAFYQAAAFADHGRAAAAYDDQAMHAAQQAAFPGAAVRLPWNYPPSFQLALAPLGVLPYVAAWVAFSAALYAAYAFLARRLFAPAALPLALLAPGAAVNLLVGQNGLLTTALIGGGALLLRTRPILAGVLFGLLTYKPHFAVLAPLVLVAGREWRALASASVTAVALVLVSAAALGADPWLAFLHKAMQPGAVFTTSTSAWRTVPSVMILARSLGLDPRIGDALHWTIAGLAAAGAAWAWTRTGDGRLRAGALAAATLLVTPYLRSYDLVLLVLPIAALADGEPAVSERAAITFAWLLPALLLLAPPPVQYAPLLTGAMLVLVLRRVASATGAKAAAPEITEWSPKPL